MAKTGGLDSFANTDDDSTGFRGNTLRRSDIPPRLEPMIGEGDSRSVGSEADRDETRREHSDQSMSDMLMLMAQMMQQNATLVSRLEESSRASERPSYHVMPDLSKTIESFDGENGPAVAKRWIEQVFTTSALHAWPDSFTYETIGCHLKGGARSWFMARRPEFENLAQFKAAFLKTFVRQQSKADLWEEMKQRKQNPGESIAAYFHDKMRLCRALGLSMSEKEEQVSIGFRSREMALHACAAQYNDEDDFFADVESFDRVLRSLNQSRTSDVRSTPILSAHLKPVDKQKPGVCGAKVTSSTRIDTQCYNCSKRGHYASKCPEPRKLVKCYNCNETGHIAKSCERPKRLNTGGVNTVTNVTDRGINKYVKEVYIGGRPIRAMVDTGSSDCTMKATVVLSGGFEIVRVTSQLRGFGSSANTVKSCGVVQADMTVDLVSAAGVVFRVVPDDVQPWDVIVGRSFTELSHVSFEKVGDKLCFREVPDQEMMKVNINADSGTIRLKTEKETSIPPATMQFVGIEMENQHLTMAVTNNGRCSRTLHEGETMGPRLLSIQPVPEWTPRQEPVALSEVRIHESVTTKQQQELIALLNKRRRSVAKNIGELGCTSLMEMDITLKPNAVPVCGKPYRATQEERNTIKGIVEEWKREGIVTETTSPYASPVLLVRKKSGESRLVVDYRRLNEQTERIHYPLPNIDEYMEVMAGASIFAVLDLAHGYLQVPLRPEARPRTAFITPDETGEFTRAVFGLMNAPFYFTKVMERALGPLRNDILVFYLDDILVVAKNWHELMTRVEAVLEALEKAGLTLKLGKCVFGMPQVEFLGFTIGAKGIEPGPDKVGAISKFPVPRNVHEVRRFLGLTGFFRRFVPKYAAITAPLTALTRKEIVFGWTEVEDAAFTQIIQILTSKPVLKVFSSAAATTELHTDASSEGLGAILLQSDGDGVLHPVYAVSRRTSDVEARYHSSKLELMAVIWAVERLRVFLIAVEFVVVTDCQALVYLNSVRTKNPQVARWASTLSEYNFEIKHRRGESMQHVDALSRAPVEDAESEQTGRAVFHLECSEEGIMLHQRTDERLRNIIGILRRKEHERSKQEKNQVRGYHLVNHLLYRREERDRGRVDLYVVPSSMRKVLLIKYHDMSGHFGLDRTLARMRRYYHFPGMRGYAKRHLRACLTCIVSKKTTGRKKGELHPIPPGDRPFSTVHVDHLGPFITTGRGNKYVLVLIDNLTKYVNLEAVKNTSAVLTVKKLRDFILRFGAPTRVISDRGTCFTADAFREFCVEQGISHTLNSSRHPQANGLAERVNRTMLPAMIAAAEDGGTAEWDRHIKSLEREINSAHNKSTGRVPYEVLLGYVPRFNEGPLRSLTQHCETYRRPLEIQEEVRRQIKSEQEKYKGRFDERRQLGVTYQLGDIIYVKTNPISTGESTKLQRRYKGPYCVTGVLPSDTYEIQPLTSSRKSKHRLTAHVSQIKIWQGPIPEDLEEENNLPMSDQSDQTSDSEEEIEESTVDEQVRIGSGGIDHHHTRERSQRTKRQPARLKDCVL